MSFVREHFPHLADDYVRRFEKADFVDASYRRKVAERVRGVCHKHGLPQRSTDALLSNAMGQQSGEALAKKSPRPARIEVTSAPASGQGSLFARAG